MLLLLCRSLITCAITDCRVLRFCVPVTELPDGDANLSLAAFHVNRRPVFAGDLCSIPICSTSFVTAASSWSGESELKSTYSFIPNFPPTLGDQERMLRQIGSMTTGSMHFVPRLRHARSNSNLQG